MLKIPCPFCGERPHSEFKYGKDGSIDYPSLDATLGKWHDAVFMRSNQIGKQQETWHHVLGCGSWLLVTRDTLTHHISSAKLTHHQWSVENTKETSN